MSNDEQRPIDTLEGKAGCAQEVANLLLLAIVGLIILVVIAGAAMSPTPTGWLPTPLPR